MKIIPLLASASLFVAALLPASVARADAAPTCNQFDGAKSCDQASVGKACDDGKTCYEVNCEAASGGGSKVYKCLACPSVVEDTGKVCEAGPSAFGKACGDGGTCSRPPSYCNIQQYVACLKDEPSQGQGGGAGAGGSGGQGGEGGSGGSAQAGSSQAGSGGSPQAGSGGSAQAGSSAAGSSAAGSGSSDDDSGCAVATSGARRQGALAGLMLALGAAALFAERRKRG